jgi:hypothetical protein
MANRVFDYVKVDWNGTQLRFVSPADGSVIATVVPSAANTTTVTVTSTSAASAYTGASSSISATCSLSAVGGFVQVVTPQV